MDDDDNHLQYDTTIELINNFSLLANVWNKLFLELVLVSVDPNFSLSLAMVQTAQSALENPIMLHSYLVIAKMV